MRNDIYRAAIWIVEDSHERTSHGFNRHPPPLPARLPASAWAAWPWSCWPEQTAGGASRRTDPLAPRRAALSRRRRRTSSTCTWPGSPPHLDLFDYKPELVRRNGQDCPESFLRGRRFAFTCGVPKLLGTPQRFARHGQSGAWMSAAVPHLADRRRRADVHQVDVHRPVQPRPGGTAAVHRLAAVRPAVDGVVGDLRPGLREPEPARLHRAGLQRHLPQRRQQRLEQRLSAVGLPGRAVPFAGRSGAVRLQPARHGPRRAPPEPRRPARPQRDAGGGAGQPGDAHAHRPVRAGLPHADGGARGDGHLARAAARPRQLRRAAGRVELRQQLPAGAPAGRAGRALRAAARLGLGLPRHRPGRGHPDGLAQQVPRHGPRRWRR